MSTDKLLTNFIKKSEKKFPNLINFSKCKYIHPTKKVILICNICGHERSVTPYQHLSNKFHCPKCSYKKLRKVNFINTTTLRKRFNKRFNNKFEYDWSTYKDMKTKMKMVCPIHGEFWQIPSDHENCVYGCQKCAEILKRRPKKLSIDIIKNEFYNKHQNNYFYFWETYSNTYTKMKIKCLSCNNVFWQSAEVHKNGHGCPFCKKSNGELKIIKFLTEKNINYIRQHKFDDCKYKYKLSFDFYIPNLNICIEFDGKQHYEYIDFFHRTNGKFKDQQLRDKIKNNYCYVNKIKLIRIPYWDIDNIEKFIDFV